MLPNHSETNFNLKVVNFAAGNKSWRLVCNPGNVASCKSHCSKQFPGDALSIDECTKAVTEAFTGGVGACFPMNSVVTRKSDGIIPLSQLRVGDEILVPAEQGISFDKVIGFLHRDEDCQAEFIQLLFGNRSLSIHADHLIPVFKTSKSDDKGSFVRAESVIEGSFVNLVWIDGCLTRVAVSKVARVVNQGLCCPVTLSGLIIVDSVVCSCYSPPSSLLTFSVSHSMCHAVMAPLRFQFSNRAVTDVPSEKPSRVHPYAKVLLSLATGAAFA